MQRALDQAGTDRPARLDVQPDDRVEDFQGPDPVRSGFRRHGPHHAGMKTSSRHRPFSARTQGYSSDFAGCQPARTAAARGPLGPVTGAAPALPRSCRGAGNPGRQPQTAVRDPPQPSSSPRARSRAPAGRQASGTPAARPQRQDHAFEAARRHRQRVDHRFRQAPASRSASQARSGAVGDAAAPQNPWARGPGRGRAAAPVALVVPRLGARAREVRDLVLRQARPPGARPPPGTAASGSGVGGSFTAPRATRVRQRVPSCTSRMYSETCSTPQGHRLVQFGLQPAAATPGPRIQSADTRGNTAQASASARRAVAGSQARPSRRSTAVVQALHAEAHPVEPRGAPGARQLRRRASRGWPRRSARGPRSAGSRPTVPASSALHQLRLERRGRAAADVRGAPADGRRRPAGGHARAAARIRATRRDQAAPQRARRARGAREVAVGADRSAERDVDVEADAAAAGSSSPDRVAHPR